MQYINIQSAIEKLLQNEIVAIPTETVYGLAGNIHSEKAINNIFKTKNRPIDHPLIVHIPINFDIEKYAKINNIAEKIISKYWPAPLTLVLPKTKYVNYLVTGKQETVALRCPQHNISQEILQGVNSGIAAPSANKFGYISPTKASHVYDEFEDENFGIVDGGECEIGIESSIVMINCDNTISILRKGMFDINILQEIADIKENLIQSKVSGALLSHYSPINPLIMINNNDLLQKIDSKQINLLENFFIIFQSTADILNIKLENNILILPNNPNQVAKIIYDYLRIADNFNNKNNLKCIYLEQIPNNIQWAAIKDRLEKASYNTANIIKGEKI